MSTSTSAEVRVVTALNDHTSRHHPNTLCLTSRRLSGGRTAEVLRGRLQSRPLPSYPTHDRALIVAFEAEDVLACHLDLEWPLPVQLIDLRAEHRCLFNGRTNHTVDTLVGASLAWGLPPSDAFFDAAIRGRIHSSGLAAVSWDEVRASCQARLRATARLFEALRPHLDLPRALIRGQYTAAVAGMERTGVPIDETLFDRLCANWPAIQRRLVTEIDKDYGVFEGLRFRADRWEQWLARKGIIWPRVSSGYLDLSEDTFRDMARAHPVVRPVRDLRATLHHLRLQDLRVDPDGRNRTRLRPFRSKTGRNEPRSKEYIFAHPAWRRHLIRPDYGTGIAHIDWVQQEFAIAAYLSGDLAMQRAYETGDAYLAFAHAARAVPEGATRPRHPAEREAYKTCALGVQYGMGVESLAVRINRGVAHAEELLRRHRSLYPTFWQWSEAVVDSGLLHGHLDTVFGWRLHVTRETNHRSLRNFMVQGNAAEMLRIACILAMERGIQVCAPIHDALLIEAPADEIEEAVRETQQCMREASSVVLGGPSLRTEAQVFVYPDHYHTARGQAFWQTVLRLLEEVERDGRR
jgi:hypothetical protein